MNGGISIKKSITVRKDFITGILFLMYFCSRVVSSVLARLFGAGIMRPLFALLFFVLLLLCIVSNPQKAFVPLIVYFIIALCFLITYIFHPEYITWFTHSSYGIVPGFLYPSRGIWAFLVVWIVKDERRLYYYLKIACWGMFLFLLLQFVVAKVRGYWVVAQPNGSVINSEYDMEYGYDMLFPVSFFGAEIVIRRRKMYAFPFIVGAASILLGGSRGAIIWVVALFFFALPFRWNDLTGKQRVFFCAFLLLFLAFTIVAVLQYDAIMKSLAAWMSRRGISSRTLNSLVSGSFSDGNGRIEIYQMACELIKTGGALGRGVYGDRYYIGNFFQWGYSHDIFLELLVSFGYIGGSILILLLIFGVFFVYRHCYSLEKQVVWITFLTTSMKLILSNSFWYNAAFWTLLAIIIKTKKMKSKKKRTIETELGLAWEQ